MKNKIRKITHVSLCVAILAVLSQLSIPVGATFLTVQAFAVALVGYILGAKDSLSAICVYILVGAVGVPVFAGLRGGFSVLIGYTGGFIFGFLPICFLCGVGKNKKLKGLLLGFIGLIFCHLLGALQYMLVSDLDFISSFTVSSLPFILKDALLIICAFSVGNIINKRLKI